jgi:hypothetical protein
MKQMSENGDRVLVLCPQCKLDITDTVKRGAILGLKPLGLIDGSGNLPIACPDSECGAAMNYVVNVRVVLDSCELQEWTPGMPRRNGGAASGGNGANGGKSEEPPE